MKALPVVLLLAIAGSRIQAQTTFLYGAAFYEEYMPEDRLDKDVQLMEQAGLNVVRVGESTWSLWEPEDGRFELAWMDRIVERLARAHIRVIMGTPTYSIPPWMFKEHPEILVTHLDGQKATYGIRQNMDITNPDFLRYAERAIRKIAEHYRDNRAIIGYQIDNETTSYGTAGDNVQAGFVHYLQEKFSSVDRLNKIWGLVYWGQSLHDWSEVPPRNGILNPGWKLEWDRYQDSLATRYLAWQAALVREYLRPDQFVMQDFGGATRSDVNEYAISKSLDVVGINPYHPTQDLYDGEGSSYGGDFARSLKGSNYLVTETNAQTIGWDSRTQFPPYDGQLRQDVYLMAATGANMVEYWHWHSLHYGQETYWKGVLSHDLEPGRTYAEVARTAHELQRIGPEIVDLKTSHPVALLYSNDFAPRHRLHAFSGVATGRRYAMEPSGRIRSGDAPLVPGALPFKRWRGLRVPGDRRFEHLQGNRGPAAVHCERRAAGTAGGLCARGRTPGANAEERLLRRVLDRAASDGSGAAARGCRLTLSGIFESREAAGPQGRPFPGRRRKPRERLGRYVAAGQSQGAGLLRSPVLRKVSGYYGEPFRQGHGDLRRFRAER
jgi:beta-galactosidase GanA